MRTAAVNHDRWVALRACFSDRTRRLADMFSGEVRTLRAAAQDNVHVLVSTRLDDGGDTHFRDTHERVLVAARTHGVNRDGHPPVRAILETDWEGYTGGEFAMELRLGSACADSAPRNKVVEILRGYGVEKFRADGNAKMGEVTKELPSGAKPLVYLKRTIYGRIVDKAFPTNCCTWFLGWEGGMSGKSSEFRKTKSPH